ncbi:MAG: hypothetical protein Q4C42_02780 [Clostridia bacterium]|nr:hypothetical protein [Clostridia bacterium]
MSEIIEKLTLLILLVVDFLAVLTGMIAGPLDHTAISTAASVCAAIISLAVIIYCYYNRKK